MKKNWNYFTDIFSKTIVHPQFFLKCYEYEAIKELKKKGKGTIVDIGCGRQTYKIELLTKFNKYIGIDHPEVSKRYSEKEMPDILADAQKLPLKNKYCETASMISVLEHLPNPQKALNEAFRILKTNGLFVLITVQNYPLHDMPFDFYRYTRFSLINLLENAGFTKIQVKPIGTYPIFAGQMLNVFLLHHLKKLLYSKSVINKALGAIFIAPIFGICLISNLIALFFSHILDDYEKGAFAIYNLAIAKKSTSSSRSK